MILSIIISIVSVVVGGVIIFLGRDGGMSSTGPFIALSVLGAPLTFLHRIFWSFGWESKVPLYGMYFLYFLSRCA